VRLVQHAALPPHRCAVVPFIGNSSAKRGFVDTGMDLPGRDPHVYVSVDAVEQMARMVGWQPAFVLDDFRRQIADLKGELEALKAIVAQRDEQLDAVKVLKNAGFAQQGVPGRPRKAAA
jgi:hypothetical protein